MAFAHFTGAGLGPGVRIDGAEIRIGRSETSDLRLAHAGVRFNHAVLRVDERGVSLRAEAGAFLGPPERQNDAVLLARIGDNVEIGPYVLTITNIETGGDVTISVAISGADAQVEAALGQLHFANFTVALPNVRLWASVLSCIVLVIFFVWPLLSLPTKAGTSRDPLATGSGTVQFADWLPRAAGLWNVGVMSHAHAGIGENCAFCHQTPFVPVRSDACLACHQGIGQHADPRLAPGSDISQQRCETCHHEHKGFTIATRDRQADCVACHGDIDRIAPTTALHNVLDFGLDHPQFKPALVQDSVLRLTKRFEIGDLHAEDHSNVRFTHATHLKLAKYRVLAGGDACGSCHAAEPGGVTFKPVTFDDNCASCHTLQFEPLHPEWRMPHGHPEEVASRIAGYYAQAALAGEHFSAPPTEPFFKPGAPPPALPPTGTDMVSYKTAEAMISSIARSTCGECHVTLPPSVGQPPTAWRIASVFVPDRYMPTTLFSHAAHAMNLCTACHAAKDSDGGAIALLPGIAVCRTCHAGEAGGTSKIASTCVSCHRFHDDRLPLKSGGSVGNDVRDRPTVSEQNKELR